MDQRSEKNGIMRKLVLAMTGASWLLVLAAGRITAAAWPDSLPVYVHVYRDGRLILKWDLNNQRAMAGRPSGRALRLIRELDHERLL